MISLRVACLTAIAMLAVSCTRPLMLPGPILTTADKAGTRAAIFEGMAVRGWVVEDEMGEQVLARLDHRTHVAKVLIDYAGRQIQFRYGGSERLNCKREGDSCRAIHRNYNRWVRNLGLDISRAVTRQRGRESLPGASPRRQELNEK